MGHRGSSQRGTLVRLLVLFCGGVALGALSESGRPKPVPQRAPIAQPPPPPDPEGPAAPVGGRRGRRLGVAVAFAALFVSGASLTAWAGNETAQLVDPAAPGLRHAVVEGLDVTTDAVPLNPAPPAIEPQPSDAPAGAPHTLRNDEAALRTVVTAPAPPAIEPQPSDAPVGAPDTLRNDDAAPRMGVTAPAAPEQPAPAPVVVAAAVQPAPAVPVRTASVVTSRRQPVVAPRTTQARIGHVVRAPQADPDPETTAPGTVSIVWVNRALPDPTPPSRRLERSFARVLHGAAGDDWPLTLGLLRAEGADGPFPADASTVQALAARLAEQKSQGRDDWQAVAAIAGDSTVADRAVALAHLERAVGLETLITGLEASKARLARRVLADPRVSVYAGGREDIAAGRVNVRVVTMIAYLADTFGGVEISSLVTGHRLFARPRVISAHVYGDAVDVAALGGTPIVGHQEPGGVTEKAVRALLLLPAELEPRQIISLLGLGGPSFPLADHADHIHVGF